MAISLRLSAEETKLIKSYAALKKQSVSEVIRTAVIERIEDDYDLNTYNKAMKEHSKNPVTYTLDEVERELGL